ncbi:MAG: hypothetical protein M5U34_13770 [Chloroflexi bacterium]|nr:hypothetical protein [Chloroflexota bacterium]
MERWWCDRLSPLLLPDSVSQLSEPVNFGGLFELVGLETAVSPDHLLIHLWWQATADVTQDYTIFIHVLDENGNLIAQSDATPAQGSSPTSHLAKRRHHPRPTSANL